MNSNTSYRRVHESGSRIFFMTALLLTASTFAQERVLPTGPLYNADGRTVGFSTNDPGTYFVLPGNYQLAQRDGAFSAYLTSAGEGSDGKGLYDLRLVLTPSYAHAAAPVARLHTLNPQALFFPLPMFIDEVRLFLPEALGSIVVQLTPDDGLSTPFALYYRLRLSEAQVAVLQALARSGLALQGVVGTTYTLPDGEQYSSVPMTLILPTSTFSSVLPPQAPQAGRWLRELMEDTHLSVEGALDGRYALGGGMGVTLRNSTVEGFPRIGSFTVQEASEGKLRVVATASPNLDGQARIYVAELGLWIVLSYQAVFEAELDLWTMEVTLTRLEVTSVQVNGTNSLFYRRVLADLLRQPKANQQLSAALTHELQERILAHTLFGVGLP